MVLRPATVPSQAAPLSALQQAGVAYPVCQAWGVLSGQLALALPALGAAGLLRAGSVCLSLAKVLWWVQDQIPQEVPALSYVGALALSAHEAGIKARVASLNPGGTAALQLTAAAVAALQALQQWDPVLGNYVPADPAGSGLRLAQGVVLP